MFKKILIAALLAGGSSLALSEEPVTCELKATLLPESMERFWRFGTDSWFGKGIIECSNSDDSRPRQRRSSTGQNRTIFRGEAFVRFESWIPGMGPLVGNGFEMLIKDINITNMRSLFGGFRSFRSSIDSTLIDRSILVAESLETRWIAVLKLTGNWDQSYARKIGLGQIIISKEPLGDPR